jgi:hypothetical protein
MRCVLFVDKSILGGAKWAGVGILSRVARGEMLASSLSMHAAFLHTHPAGKRARVRAELASLPRRPRRESGRMCRGTTRGKEAKGKENKYVQTPTPSVSNGHYTTNALRIQLS